MGFHGVCVLEPYPVRESLSKQNTKRLFWADQMCGIS